MARMRRLALLILLGALASARPEAGLAAGSADALRAQILKLQSRLATGGTGLLVRYEGTLERMSGTLDKGEIRSFSSFVREEILTPWRQVPQDFILEMSLRPPGHGLSPSERQMLTANSLRLRKIELQLRRARRLLATIEQGREDGQRQAREITRTAQRFEQAVDELAREDAASAQRYRDWFAGEFAPVWERLRARAERDEVKVDGLLRWTEEPELRDMLGQLRQVTRAMEQLRGRYQLGELSGGSRP